MSDEPETTDPVPSGDRAGRLAFLSKLALDTRPLRHRDFRNLWIGQAVSTIGGMIGTVAVPYQMYALTGSTLYVGLLGLAALVPLLVVSLVGGAIADAGDRRSVLLRTETGMAVVTALFLANAALPHPQVWALFALEAVAVSIYSLGRPAMSSLTPRLVPDDQIAAASALTSVYYGLAAMAGPALGGILIATLGVPWTFGIDLATTPRRSSRCTHCRRSRRPRTPTGRACARSSTASASSKGSRRCSGSSPSTPTR